MVKTIINTGETIPNNKNDISNAVKVDAFTSSPCLLHDCLIFIGVSFVYK